MKNERTSARVARIAAKVLRIKTYRASEPVAVEYIDGRDKFVTWGDVRALAASCLTQTAPKKAKK